MWCILFDVLSSLLYVCSYVSGPVFCSDIFFVYVYSYARWCIKESGDVKEMTKDSHTYTGPLGGVLFVSLSRDGNFLF